MNTKDTRATEVYRLQPSNPPGKVVIRKGSNLVVVWPGDLHDLITKLVDLEWEMDGNDEWGLDTQHIAT